MNVSEYGNRFCGFAAYRAVRLSLTGETYDLKISPRLSLGDWEKRKPDGKAMPFRTESGRAAL